MPQQLIYTSAPRGIVAGRSGHCTVARSAEMREPLMLRLEQLSYYHHLSLGGGRERPILACRIVDIRGIRFHVLTRIQDAGLDFTGRTNFLAHHLAFTPEELSQMPAPAVILRDWSGWQERWTGEPTLFPEEDWTSLASLASQTSLPAQTWQRLTGDAANAYSLLELKAGTVLRADGMPEASLLSLFAESTELLELRDPRRNPRLAAWQFTFTNSLQEQDNPADFRWRCVHGDSPAFLRFAGPECPALADMRPAQITPEEARLARTGRQRPLFAVQPQDVSITEGGSVRLGAKADGVPSPAYQWFSVDRSNNGTPIEGATAPTLELPEPPLGTSRYVVQAWNSAGETMSRVAAVSVERKLRIALREHEDVRVEPKTRAGVPIRSAEEIQAQRNRIEAERLAEEVVRRQKRGRWLGVVLAVLALCAAGLALWHFVLPKLRDGGASSSTGTASANSATNAPIREAQAGTQVTPGTSSIATNPPATGTNAPSSAAAQGGSSRETNSSAGKSAAITPPTSSPGAESPKESNFDLPDGWATACVGSGDLVARSHYQAAKRTFHLSGAGRGPDEKGDDLAFCYANMHGRTNCVFYVGKHGIGPEQARYGAMFRAGLEPSAPFVFLGASVEGIVFQHGSATDRSLAKTRLHPQNQGHPWLKLEWTNSSFIAYCSYGGTGWQLVGKCEDPGIPASNYLLGFAVWTGGAVPRENIMIEWLRSDAKPGKL